MFQDRRVSNLVEGWKALELLWDMCNEGWDVGHGGKLVHVCGAARVREASLNDLSTCES